MTTFTIPDDINLEQGTEVAHALKVLLESDGWKYYIGIVQSQQATRLNSLILTPLERMDQVLEQEYRKGEIASLKLCLELPQGLYDDLEANLAALREQRANEPEGDQE